MKNDRKSSGPNQRQLRVGEIVRHALASFLARSEIDDALLQSTVITVPEVRMSNDLKLANCYVMPLGGLKADEVVAALNRHQKFIRGRVAPALDLKFTPEFRFFVDNTFDEFGRIDALLRSDRVKRDLEDSGGDAQEDGQE
jgi:ribosome-binding factor A